jgi:membrane protein required for colicin V production
MNGVDILIIAILIAATLIGLLEGFIVQTAAILGAVLGLAVAQREYLNLRQLLVQVLPSSQWLSAIAYLLIFAVVWTAVVLIARRLRSVVHMLMLGLPDRAAGAVIGFLQGLILVELLIAIGLRLPNQSLHHDIHHSTLGPTFQTVIPWVDRLFPHLPY